MSKQMTKRRWFAGFCMALVMTATMLTASGALPAAAEENAGPYDGRVLTFRSETDSANVALGMWVWDIRVIIGDDPRTDMDAAMLLDMLAKNHVTEIYLGYAYLMDDDQVAANGGVLTPGMVSESQLHDFIAACSAIEVRVSLLTATSGAAAYDWWDASLGYAETTALINRATAINSRASSAAEKLFGVHIDLEPDWDRDKTGQLNRAKNLQDCADYVTAMRTLCDARNLEFALDINAWMGGSSDTVTDETGAVTPLMDVLTKKCQSLAIMAYRNSAAAQYEIAADEIAFAKVNGCQLLVGTATYLAYDFTVYERTLYIDVRFDGDREAGNIHLDRVLRGGGGLPPGHYRGVIPLEGTVYHNPLSEIEGLYLASPEGGYITVENLALVTVTPYNGGFVPAS